MLTEGVATCPICEQNTLIRYGSVGYYEFNACPNCGCAEDSENDYGMSVLTTVIDVEKQQILMPSLSGLRTLIASHSDPEDILYNTSFETYSQQYKTYTETAQWSGHLSLVKDSVYSVNLTLVLMGDRLILKKYDSNWSVYLNGTIQNISSMNYSIKHPEQFKSYPKTSTVPLLLLMLMTEKYVQLIQSARGQSKDFKMMSGTSHRKISIDASTEIVGEAQSWISQDVLQPKFPF